MDKGKDTTEALLIKGVLGMCTKAGVWFAIALVISASIVGATIAFLILNDLWNVPPSSVTVRNESGADLAECVVRLRCGDRGLTYRLGSLRNGEERTCTIEERIQDAGVFVEYEIGGLRKEPDTYSVMGSLDEHLLVVIRKDGIMTHHVRP